MDEDSEKSQFGETSSPHDLDGEVVDASPPDKEHGFVAPVLPGSLADSIARLERSPLDQLAQSTLLGKSFTNMVFGAQSDFASLASATNPLSKLADFGILTFDFNNWLTSNWTRSRASDFKAVDQPPTSYSDRLRSAGSYFADQEAVVDSMGELNQVIHRLTEKAQSVTLVWRGQQNADWALHSSLFRQLAALKGVVPPARRPKGPQPYPSEDEMVAAEKAVLRVARESWRFGQMSAMETIARLQHQGAPTRLLDVTRNPYIAAWFAVEANDEHDSVDARVFALGTEPVPKSGVRGSERGHVALGSALTQGYEPFWHTLDSSSERQKLDWGTGSNRIVWVPPEYDPRIAAQNAAFILDGVPMFTQKVSKYFKTSDGHTWTKADLLASASIYARMYSTTQKPRYNAARIAPSFSIRITANAKSEIRQMLERWFGYSRATIYPDFGGLSQHIRNAFGEIVTEATQDEAH